MKNKKLFWIPRILAIAYILFLSLFSFDTDFGIGFLIHLLPSMIFTGCLILAWFKPKVGGILFSIAGLGTIIVFNTYRDLFVLFMISVIPIIIGIAFALLKRKK